MGRINTEGFVLFNGKYKQVRQHCKTTKIYTHLRTKSIQNIKTPFDDLRIY